MPDVIPDTEWSLRSYLRTQVSPIKVYFEVPGGNPTEQMITVDGRVGGAPDGAIDVPRVQFSCWGPHGGDGRSLALAAMNALVSALEELEVIGFDDDTMGYGAVVNNVVWNPDTRNASRPIPRYIVDATLAVG